MKTLTIPARTISNHSFTCRCGATHTLSLWALAHLDEELSTTCQCGRKIIISPEEEDE